MKHTLPKLALLGFIFTVMPALSQVQMTDGPELENDRDCKMNRMLKGDDNSFYCYRVRSRGRGTSFFIEKYSKASLKPEFSKEINLGEESETIIEDVEYAAGNVFIFRRQYNKKEDKMSLFFQTVSSSGAVSKDLKEIVTITSDHYEFVDFEIFPNPANTKFVVKATHKADKKDTYKTDLILVDAVNIKKLNTRRVNENLHTGGTVTYSFWSGFDVDSYGFIGLFLDNNDNIYYCVNEKIKGDKENRRNLNLYTLPAGEETPKKLNLPFDDYYFVGDIEFSKANDGDIVVGGVLTDIVERKGRDLVKCGMFSFKVNTTKNTITGKATEFFDDKMLAALESSAKKARYNNYKLDYIMPIGDAVYYIGEQYRVTQVTRTSSTGQVQSVSYRYEYMDVIVAKLNSKGDFEWIKNVPLRNEMSMNFQHVFKQYIAVATDKSLYILCDDHPKNIERYKKDDFEPKDLKSVQGIHGSNFVCNVVNLSDGKVKNRVVLMKNEDYCFAPIQERNPQFIPPPDCEIFVPSKNNEVYIYTEDRGRDRFAKIKFD